MADFSTPLTDKMTGSSKCSCVGGVTCTDYWNSLKPIEKACLIFICLGGLVFLVLFGCVVAKETIVKVEYDLWSGKCTELECISASKFMEQNIDTKVKQCDDYFGFSCGGFKNTGPESIFRKHKAVLSDVYSTNMNALHAIVSQRQFPPQLEQFGDKAAKFYTACVSNAQMNDFYENADTSPLLRDISSYGGWWALTGSFEANLVFQKSSLVGNRVESFFHVQTGYDSSKSAQIFVRPPNRIALRGFKQRNVEGMRTIVRDLGTYLIRDGQAYVKEGINPTQNLEVFVSDVIEVGKIVESSDSFDLSSMVVDVRKLTTSYPKVEFEQTLTAIYGNVDSSTKITLTGVVYFDRLTEALNNLDNADRAINNYIVFRMAFANGKFYQHDYQHLFYQYLDLITATQPYQVRRDWELCLDATTFFLPHLLDALFVSVKYDEAGHALAQQITDTVKQAVVNRTRDITWLAGEPELVDTLVDKLTSLTIMVGRPDNWNTPENIKADLKRYGYDSISVSDKDLYSNVKESSTFHWTVQRNKRSRPLAGYAEWDTPLYVPTARYNPNENVLMIPAGRLIFPLFSKTFTSFQNFGSLGSTVGHLLFEVIYDTRAQWPQPVYQKFTDKLNCTQTLYQNLYQNLAWVGRDPTEVAAEATKLARRYAPYGAAMTAGVQVALEGFETTRQNVVAGKISVDAWNEQHQIKVSKVTSPEQAFFLGFSQSLCDVATDPLEIAKFIESPDFPARHAVPGLLKVNGALLEASTFKLTHACSLNDPMTPHPPHYCLVF